jgi:TPR repeat protein
MKILFLSLSVISFLFPCSSIFGQARANSGEAHGLNEYGLTAEEMAAWSTPAYRLFPPPSNWRDMGFSVETEKRMAAYERAAKKIATAEQRTKSEAMAQAAVADFYAFAPSRTARELAQFLERRPEIALSDKFNAIQDYIKMRQTQDQPPAPATNAVPIPAPPSPPAPTAVGKDLNPEQMMKLAEMKISSPAAYEEAVKMFIQAGYNVPSSAGHVATPHANGPSLIQKNATIERMWRIIFPKVQFQNASVAEALEYLRIGSRDLDTAQGSKGVNIILDENEAPSNAAITLDLKNVPMLEALRYITELAQMKYVIENDTVQVKSLQEASKWFRKAAEQGDADAQTDLGLMYDNGEGVAQDYVEARKWYLKAAEQNDPLAQNNLASMYHSGDGGPQDNVEALKWYRKAAEQGIAAAQFNLGAIYDKGEGVNQDFVEARKWFLKAAEQGHVDSQFSLGMMYRNGDGVPKDYAEAYAWFSLAAKGGDSDAMENLTKFEKAATPEDKERSLKRAAELMDKFNRP